MMKGIILELVMVMMMMSIISDGGIYIFISTTVVRKLSL